MPVTLAQAQVNTQDDVDFNVIDNLRRYSWLMDRIVFDDVVMPSGDATLTYGYTRLTQAAPANFRALNTEYVAGQALRQRYTVDLKPLGGAVTIDRVLAALGPAASNEVAFQLQQLNRSIITRFQDEVINGDTATDIKGFDGLDKALTGQTTEFFPGGTNNYVDWSASTVDTQAEANTRLDELDLFLSGIVPSTVGSVDIGAPGALPPGEKAVLGNTRSIARVRALARWASMYTSSKDDLGRQIEKYGDWTLVDIGDKADGSGPIIPIETRNPGGGNQTNLTDLYAVTFGMDAFHGASMAGTPLVQTWLPDYTSAGAVKSGEMEMGPVATVLKSSKSCGVLRNVKVS
jgi:hypothetical protein